jgi:hypothetical protein
MCIVWALWVTLMLAPLGLNAAEQPLIDAEADRLLKKMSDYLAAQEQFTLSAESTVEDVMDSGQKLMFTLQSEIAVKRPNKLYTSRKGEVRDQELFYDGQQLTLFGRTANYFARIAAPPTIDAAMAFATETLNLQAPGEDLLFSDVYSGLMADVESGFYVGPAVVAGVPCHHLAYRSAEVDWQIWIEDSDTPLPRKYVITSKWLTAAPQYTLTIRDWRTEVDIPDCGRRGVNIIA